MIRYKCISLFSLLIIFTLTMPSGGDQVVSWYNAEKKTISGCVKYAKEPFYQDIPGLHQVATGCAALIGVEDLHASFKNIHELRVSECDIINRVYNFMLKTPVDFYAAQITKGAVIKDIADFVIDECCQKGSLAHWCAHQAVAIPLDGKINLPGCCDGIKVSLDGDIFCTDFIYKQAVKSQLSVDIKNNVWAERYIKNFYKNILTWLKNKRVAVIV